MKSKKLLAALLTVTCFATLEANAIPGFNSSGQKALSEVSAVDTAYKAYVSSVAAGNNKDYVAFDALKEACAKNCKGKTCSNKDALEVCATRCPEAVISANKCIKSGEQNEFLEKDKLLKQKLAELEANGNKAGLEQIRYGFDAAGGMGPYKLDENHVPISEKALEHAYAAQASKGNKSPESALKLAKSNAAVKYKDLERMNSHQHSNAAIPAN